MRLFDCKLNVHFVTFVVFVVNFPAMLMLPTSSALAGETPGPASGVRHIVLCWLVEPGNPVHVERVIETSRELRALPGIRDLAAGRAVPSERAIVDDGFDVGVVMDFANEADMRDYLEHPEHVRRVRDTLQPLCGRIQVFDIAY